MRSETQENGDSSIMIVKVFIRSWLTFIVPQRRDEAASKRDYQSTLNALITRSISLRRDQRREDRGSNQRSARGISTYQSQVLTHGGFTISRKERWLFNAVDRYWRPDDLRTWDPNSCFLSFLRAQSIVDNRSGHISRKWKICRTRVACLHGDSLSIFMYPECTVNNLFERNKQRSAHRQAIIARIFEFAHDVWCESRANRANCRGYAVR